MATPQPEETGFLCPLVQGSQYIATAALGIHDSALISPIVYLKEPVEQVVLDLHKSLGKSLGLGQRQIDRAYREALQVQLAFQRDLVQEGRKFFASLQPNDLWVAVSGRPYNLYDERLNLRLGENLAKLKIKAIPQDFLDTSSVDLRDFPNMYWGLGAQILRTAKMIKAHPNYFGLHLTNFSCGADSFLEHFYKYIMGEKPYLILELDEHSAVAGIMTRLEAFQHVIENALQKHRDQDQRLLRASN